MSAPSEGRSKRGEKPWTAALIKEAAMLHATGMCHRDIGLAMDRTRPAVFQALYRARKSGLIERPTRRKL